jgi:hypothetical protein
MEESMSLTIQRVAVTVVWLGFMALSFVATWELGYIGVLRSAFHDVGSMQIFADLCVAAGFGSAWLHAHATARGRNPWPWLVPVLALGSIPLITYAVWSLLQRQQPLPTTTGVAT